MNRSAAKSTILAIIVLLSATSAQAALVSTAGGLGVYDNVNNVTWTSDANLMATQAASYGGGSAAYVSAVIAASGGVIVNTPNLFSPSGTYTLTAGDFDTGTGRMSWWGANAWANYLNSTNYGGSNQWALPTTVDNDSSIGYPNGGAGNPALSSSQLAQLFYGGLGQVEGVSITTTHNTNYSLFSNVQQSSAYWSGTEYSAVPNGAWLLDTEGGYQISVSKDVGGFYFWGYHALAVSPGQVAPVPLPAAAWLLLSGLGGLGALKRRRLTSPNAITVQ